MGGPPILTGLGTMAEELDNYYNWGDPVDNDRPDVARNHMPTRADGLVDVNTEVNNAVSNIIIQKISEGLTVTYNVAKMGYEVQLPFKELLITDAEVYRSIGFNGKTIQENNEQIKTDLSGVLTPRRPKTI